MDTGSVVHVAAFWIWQATVTMRSHRGRDGGEDEGHLVIINAEREAMIYEREERNSRRGRLARGLAARQMDDVELGSAIKVITRFDNIILPL